jgi:aspartate kinase
MTKVYKFGGASVRDAASIRNMSEIIRLNKSDHLVVVVSAMGKTTNLLESNLKAARNENDNFPVIFQQLVDFHINICNELFNDPHQPIFRLLNDIFEALRTKLNSKTQYDSFDEHYDACISYGELLSTQILGAFLTIDGHNFQLIDARDYIRTDDNFRQANVDWVTTRINISTLTNTILPSKHILTQGFIGSGPNRKTTTLGREGSDYTAAIFASCLNADEVVIWKDVPGLLNADPKRFPNTMKLDVISYKEALELTYYGATIIHPNTIKPLLIKNIPLKIKSFIHPELPASIICDITDNDILIPSFILKENQVLLSMSPRDFSFMNESNLSHIFNVLADIKMNINVLQTSAISLSVCTDYHQDKIELLIEKLSGEFKILINHNLTLLTIRHYKNALIPEFVASRKTLLEQRSRATLQLVLE